MMDFQIKKSQREKIIKGFEDPSYFSLEFLQKDLHDGQKFALPGMLLKDSFIHCGNRWGKGDLILVKQSWIAMYKPVAKQFQKKHIDILNSSVSQDQANIIFNKFEQEFVDLKSFSYMIKDIKRSPFPHIDFINDVSWWFRNASQNGKYLEGHNYFDINFDESDLYPDYEKFITDILNPRCWDTGGQISHTTTPRRGKKNSYKLLNTMNKEIKNGNKEFFTYNGDSRDNKFLHRKAIDKMNALPLRLLNKNVLGLFEDSDGDISSEHMDYAEYISCGLLDSPRPGYRYVTGWDLARSSTYCCAATLEIDPDIKKPLQLVSFDRFADHQNKDQKYWKTTIQKIKERNYKWGKKTVIDKTGIGDVVFGLIEDINPIGIQLANEGGRLREDIISEGISTFEMGMIGIPPLLEKMDKDKNEIWTIRDEITDFDKENLQVIIWDMVCAIFLAIWVARGHRLPGKEKKKNIPSISLVRGASKYGNQ